MSIKERVSGIDNVDIISHFGSFAGGFIQIPSKSRHLEIIKQSHLQQYLKLLAAFAKSYPDSVFDYAAIEEAAEGYKLGQVTNFCTPENAGELNQGLHDTVNLLLIAHDAKNPENLEKMLLALKEAITTNGILLCEEYNFGAWVHRKEKPEREFKRHFRASGERVAYKTEPGCFNTHSWLYLDLFADVARKAGFSQLASDTMPHSKAKQKYEPKMFIYIGKLTSK